MKNTIYNTFSKSPKIKSCLNKLFSGNLDTVSGFGASAKAMFVSYIAEKYNIPVMVVSPSTVKALSFQSKLDIVSEKNSVYFIQQESSPYQEVFSDAQVLKEELETLRKFKSGQIDILVMSAQSLLSVYPDKNFYNNNSLKIELNKEYELSKLAGNLVKIGYRRVSLVTDVGEFSLRGDILDIFPISENPVRIEFWGDNVESVRYFDIETQRTVEKTAIVIIEPRYKIVVKDRQEFEELLSKTYLEHKKNIKPEFAQTLDIWFENIMTSLETELYFEGIEYFSSFLNKEYESIFDFLPDNVLVVLDESHEVMTKIELQHKKYLDEYEKMYTEGLALPLPHLNHLDFEALSEKFNDIKNLKLDSFIENNWQIPNSTNCHPALDAGSDNLIYKNIVFKMPDQVRHDNSFFEAEPSFINCSLMPRLIPGSDDFCDYVTNLKNEDYNLIFTTQYPQRVQEILSNCNQCHPEFISGSQDYEMLNAVDSTFPCNSRFARKQEELQVQHYTNICKCDLTEGFVSSDLKLALITDVEMFNRKVKKPTLAKRIARKENIDY
ncbi:MAG: hypothetical protein WC197_09395, partial [Candidatus Gastranaerophilaceae bacterium]